MTEGAIEEVEVVRMRGIEERTTSGLLENSILIKDTHKLGLQVRYKSTIYTLIVQCNILIPSMGLIN